MPIFSPGERRVELLGEHQFFAHDATLAGSVMLENEASVRCGVLIRADNDRIRTGAGSNIQDGSVLHADPGFPLTLGRNVSVGHKAMLHGRTVGDGSLIGINSVVPYGARIGSGTLIGANALIPEGKEIPAGVLVIGSPGKIVRDLKPGERAGPLQIAAGCVGRSRRFRLELREQPLPDSAR